LAEKFYELGISLNRCPAKEGEFSVFDIMQRIICSLGTATWKPGTGAKSPGDRLPEQRRKAA
jgi:hypothetical protein